MKFEAKVINVGTSKGIVLPASIIKKLGIDTGTELIFDLIGESEAMHTFRCHQCFCMFNDVLNKDVYDCPTCDAEIISSKVELVE